MPAFQICQGWCKFLNQLDEKIAKTFLANFYQDRLYVVNVNRGNRVGKKKKIRRNMTVCDKKQQIRATK